MQNHDKSRVALYARISHREKGKEGTSIENQLYQLRRAADYHGWGIYRQYIDKLRTGTKAEGREGLRQLMLDAKAHWFDIVAVTKLDRFFRNTRLLLNHIEELDQAGVTFVSTSEGFDTSTSQGRFSMKMMGTIAEWERDRIVERTTEGRYARYREGKWGPGQPLYGYRYNRETRSLEIREDEANIVRRIYNLYAFDRLGFQQIARLLNGEHVPPRQQATRWHQAAVRDILVHPGYKGEHPRGICLPAIISPELWTQAQQRRKDNPHLHRRDGSPWLLQGLIQCGLCGHTLSCSYSHGRNGRRTYTCRGRLLGTHASDNHRCTLPPMDAEWLEGKVSHRLESIFANPAKLETMLSETIERLRSREAELNSQLRPVDNQLTEVREKKARLAEAWVESALSKGAVEKRRALLDTEEQRLKNIRQEIDPAQVEELERTRNTIRFWQAFLKSAKGTEERAAIDSVGDRNYSINELQPVVTLTMTTLMAASLGIAEQVSEKLAWPLTLRQVLDRLQTKLVAFPDRVEFKAIFPISSVVHQGSSPGYRLGHYLQFQ